MQLSELVALLSLAAVNDASKEDNLGNVLVKAGTSLPPLLLTPRIRLSLSRSRPDATR